MKKIYYSADSLTRVLRSLERKYGMASRDFYARVLSGERLDIPRFTRHVWASFYRDVRRGGGGGGE